MSSVVQLKSKLDEDREAVEDIFSELKENTRQLFVLAIDEEENVSLVHNFSSRGDLALVYLRAQDIMKEIL